MRPALLPGLLMLLGVACGAAIAGEADVLRVDATATGDGRYRFRVTVRHADSGWDHYADRWEVRAPDGAVLATRVLHHPHTDEQPFTRSLSAVRIPAGIGSVTLYAHDKVHGFGGETRTVALPNR